MAWTTVVTHATGDVFPAADWNTYVRDNEKYLHGDSGAVDLSAGAAAYTFGNVLNIGTAASPVGQIVLTTPATVLTSFRIFRTTDANPTFQLNNNGVMLWGSGGATAPDANLYWKSAGGNLQTDGTFWMGASAVTGAVGGTNTFYVGSALDTYMFRYFASVFAINGSLFSAMAAASVTVPLTWTPNLANGLLQKFNITGGGANTLTIAPPNSGPGAGQTGLLVLRIANTGGGTVPLSWNAVYSALGATALPASVANGATSTALFISDPNAGKWALLAVN